MSELLPLELRGFQRKVLAIFGIVAVLIAGLAGVTWKVAADAADAAKWVNHTYEVLDHLGRIQLDTVRIELATQGFRVSGDPARIEERDRLADARERSLAQVEALVRDNPAQEDRLATLRAIIAQRLAISREVEAVRRSAGAEAANAHVQTLPLAQTRQAAAGILDAMMGEERRLLRERQELRQSRQRLVVAGSAASAVLVLALLAATYVLIRRQLGLTEASRQALARSERSLQATLLSIGDGVIATDTGACLVHMNPVAEAMTGWSAEEARGRPIATVFRIINEHTREPAPIPVQEALATGEVRGLANHTVLVARDGVERPIADSAAPIRNLDGQITGVVLVFRDMTAEHEVARLVQERNTRLESEVAARTQELRESQARLQAYQAELEVANQELQALFDHAPVGILVSRQRRVVSCNRKLEELLGYDAGELQDQVTRPWYGSEEEFLAVGAEVREALAAEGTSSREMPLVRKDGTRRWFRFRMQALNPGEAAGLVLTIIEDASEEHETLERLEQQKARAVAENAAKGSFLANISHEIRTPLNAITGMAQLMRRRGLELDQRARLDKIETAAEHLLSVVNDVLDLSKIDAGKFVLDDQPMQVGAVIANVVSMLQDRAAAKQLELASEVQALPPNLCGDATRVQQCLLNYAGNAIKFTHRGKVTLRALLAAEDDEGVQVRFEVADTGPGIAPADLDRLFAAFEQADNSITRQHGGTGLGLAITQRLANLMGGEAGASSTPGQGSTFWFTVRLRKAAGEVAAPPEQAWEDGELALRARCAGARVLVTDDDPINRELTSIRLKEAGLLVDLACDGEEALEMARAAPYDLILMDMQMPRVDGLEATRRLRRMPGLAGIPVVAMTANAFAEDRIRCLEAGMNDFIPKPCKPEQFYGTMLAWLKPRPGAGGFSG
ncbi:response regulator [Ramlibacter sp. MAHUQ-53]|uniref:response regulator n=1 Tax=unclassified Ramlibacter TaxID=2617605 RepID=UPI00363C1253